MTDTEPGGTQPNAADDAGRLWCGRFDAVLSTLSQAEPGYPFGSVVPYCLDQGGRPLLLLSHLAQHSHNLAADSRCAFTVFDGAGGDVQQSRRLTCTADCEAANDALDLARYCRHFPRGQAYVRELGFRLFRLLPRRFHYNGGFATARWLGADRLLPPSPFAADADAQLLARLRADHGDWLDRYRAAGTDAPVQPIGIDRWGLTVHDGARLLRLESPTPMDGPPTLRAAIEADALRPVTSASIG